jgi:hypothetical protein
MAASTEVLMGETLQPRRTTEINGAALPRIAHRLFWREHRDLRRLEADVPKRAVCISVIDGEQQYPTRIPNSAFQLRAATIEVKLVGRNTIAHG